MAGTNPSLVVKIGANIDALKAALQLGQSELIKTAAGAQALAGSLNGQKLEQSALQMAVAIKAVGGATTLSTAEAKKADAIFTAWLEKAAKQSKAVPPELAKIAAETKTVATETKKAEDAHTSWFATIAGGTAVGHLLGSALEKGVAMGLHALEGIAEKIGELAMLGSRELGIEKAFKRLTGQVGMSAVAVLEDLKVATHGTVEESDLMIRVNENLAAGMNLTEKQYKTLASGAFALAKATGKDVKDAFDTMSDAMLTGRTRAVALLTGKIDLTKAEEDYAKKLGVTREELTSEGKIEAAREAIVNKVAGAVERLGVQTDGLGTKVKQVKVWWKDFEDELGKAIAGSPVLIGFLNDVGGALTKAFGVGREEAVKKLAWAVDELAIDLIGLVASVAPVVGAVGTEFNAIQVLFRNVMQVIDLTLLGVKTLALAGLEAADAVTPGGAFIERQQKLRSEMAALVLAIDERKKALKEDKQAEDDWWNLGQRLGQQMSEMQAKLAANRRTFEEHTEAVEQNADALGDDRDKFVNAGLAAEDHAKKLKAVMESGRGLTTAFETMFARGASGEAMFKALGGKAASLQAAFDELGEDVPEQFAWVVQTFKEMGQQIERDKTIETAMKALTDFNRKNLEEMVKDTEALATKQREALNKAFIGNAAVAEKAQSDITAMTVKEVEARIKFVQDEMKQVELGYTKGRDSYKNLQRELLRLEAERYNASLRLVDDDITKRKSGLDKNASNYKLSLDALAALEKKAKDEALRTWKERLDGYQAQTKTFIERAGGWMSSLGSVFANINSDLGQTMQILGNAFTIIGDKGKSMGDRITAGFAAAAGVINQYATGTVLAAVATGALSGAMAGQAIATLAHIGATTALGSAFMGVGAVVGALIGAYGALRAEQAAAAAEAEKAQKSYEGLKKQLMSLMGTTDDLAAVAAVLGDVTENGQDLAEVIKYLDTYNFSGTARLDYFADAWEKFQALQKDLLKTVTEGYKLASQELLDYMAVAAKTSGELAKTAREYYLSQLGGAATGLTAMFEGLGKAASASAQAAAVKMHIAAGMTEDAAKKAASSIVGIFVKSQVQATGLASAIAGTFGEMIARGASFREALAAIQGPLDTMRKQLQLTGLQGGAAFENLSRMSEIANGEITGPLTDAISGANAALQGLHNSGILNQEIFSGIAMSATDAYNQIIAQGADGQAALMMMQPTLQTIWKLQQDFGYEVDATTQALLDQAVASGLVGEAQMTDAQKQTAALEGIQDAVEQLVVLFGGTLPDAIGKTTQAAVSAASTIDGRMQTLISRDWSLDVQVNYDDPGFDPSANSSGMASGGVVYAAGGWQTKGSDIVPAMLTPGERVLTVAQNYDYENRMRSGSSAAQAPATVNITIQALDPVGLKKVVEREVVPLLVSAYRRNVNGARTDTRKELVE